MNKLIEWLSEYPKLLSDMQRKGIITTEEYMIAFSFHKNIKHLFEEEQSLLQAISEYQANKE